MYITNSLNPSLFGWSDFKSGIYMTFTVKRFIETATIHVCKDLNETENEEN